MKTHPFLLASTLLVFLVAAFGVTPSRAANAVVGTGTPASCTEAAFDTALAVANAGGGTITFDCGTAPKTITFTSQKSILTDDVTIHGDDRIILSGGDSTRIFVVNGGLTFRLQHITLRDGHSLVGGGAIEATGAQVVLESVQLLENHANDQGGALYCYVGTGGSLTIHNSLFQDNDALKGGAIYNDGCTTLIDHSTFRTNQAGSGSGGSGGAIYNAATALLTINNSLFHSNQALDGGGLYIADDSAATLDAVTLEANQGGYGGGLENSGTLTVTHSLFNLNTVTGSGGGIWNLNGTVTLEQTTVSNNTANEGGGINSYGDHVQMTDANIVGNIATGTHGGGIYHGGGTMFVTNATIGGNQASDSAASGGGIYQKSGDNLTLTNVTLVNNQAGYFGGGFYHYGRYAVLTNVTIGNNQAGAAGDAIYEDSPMTITEPGVIQMINSVIFGSANNCDGPAFQSLGHNISTGTCVALSQASDQENYAGSLNLGDLAFNGGSFPVQTMLPLTASSPLVNAGDTTQCSAADQRGAARVGVCDIGAVEYGSILPRVYLPLAKR